MQKGLGFASDKDVGLGLLFLQASSLLLNTAWH